MDCYIKEETHDRCPDCQYLLKSYSCPEKSCTQCLGLHGGFTCDDCGWSGDIDDLIEQKI